MNIEFNIPLWAFLLATRIWLIGGMNQENDTTNHNCLRLCYYWGMGNGNTVQIPKREQLAYRKVVGAIMLEQGATYDDIQAATRLSRNSISDIKKGIMKTNPVLSNAIKKSEHIQLASMGLLSRKVVTKRLEGILSNDDGSIPLSQVLKAQEVAFQQRRTLEGEASIIVDHSSMRLSADQRRSRLDELQARLDEIEARERDVIDVDADPA